MKNCLLIFALILCFINSNAQTKMTITFNDGTQKTGMYTIKSKPFSGSTSLSMLVSTKPKEKIKLDDFKSVIVYEDTIKIIYEVIDVKTNFKSKKTEKKLGELSYSGPLINMYFVKEKLFSEGYNGKILDMDIFHTYIKRKNDSIAYNMGSVVKSGAPSLKNRIKDYFTDCPKLVEMVELEFIDKYKTKLLIDYYEQKCSD